MLRSFFVADSVRREEVIIQTSPFSPEDTLVDLRAYRWVPQFILFDSVGDLSQASTMSPEHQCIALL